MRKILTDVDAKIKTLHDNSAESQITREQALEGFNFLKDQKILAHFIATYSNQQQQTNPLTMLLLARSSDELFIKFGFELDELHAARTKYSLESDI